MKKHLTLPIIALMGGVVALGLRLLQNYTGFEVATGLPAPGNLAGTALLLWLFVIAVALIITARTFPREKDSLPKLPGDFIAPDAKWLVLPMIGIFLIGLSGLTDIYEGLNLGNLLVTLDSTTDSYGEPMVLLNTYSHRTRLLLGVLSSASAVGLFPAVAACGKNLDAVKFCGKSGLLIAPIALLVRLVLTYRLNSVNPVLQAYYVELLALVFLTLAFYRLSSFAFAAGQTRRFALYTGGAVVLCLAALAEGEPHLSSSMLYVGSSCVLLGFLLLRINYQTQEAIFMTDV